MAELRGAGRLAQALLTDSYAVDSNWECYQAVVFSAQSCTSDPIVSHPGVPSVTVAVAFVCGPLNGCVLYCCCIISVHPYHQRPSSAFAVVAETLTGNWLTQGTLQATYSVEQQSSTSYRCDTSTALLCLQHRLAQLRQFFLAA